MYEYIPSPNKSSRKGQVVSGIISHFTAWGEMNGTVRYMCNKVKAPENLTKGVVTINGIKYYDAQASCTYMTGRDGRTIMLVPENEAAWHAGSRTTRPKLHGRGSLNLWTIGHEICNWGGLRREGDKFYCWPDDWTYEYKGPTPINILRKCKVAESYELKDGSPAFEKGVIEYWEPYTEEAVAAIKKLWKELIDRYQITRDYIAGHEDVDPTRKIDPGPAFPWDEILDELYPKESPDTSDLLNYTIFSDEPLEEVIPVRSVPRNETSGISNCIFSILSK